MKLRFDQANSVGPIAYLGGTENIAMGNREFASPSRVWQWLMTSETRWRRIEIIGMAEFGLGFRSYVEVGK